MATKLENILGYVFHNPALMDESITHRSAGSQHNERLEYLGDSILNFVVAHRLFELFPDADEGHLSRMRAKIVRKQALAEVSRRINLGDFLKLGSGELKSGGFRRESIIADALEAVIGAVLLDGGFEASRDLILRLFDEMLSSVTPDDELKDPKSLLQEYLQSRQISLPEYQVTRVSGPPHEQSFVVSCRIEAIDKTIIGQGRSRRKAEQDAASKALEEIVEGKN